jgi:CDP-glycerol glycerophosphotransferase
MARLSIVLPIYNVEAYLPATLGSLARQTHRDIEVVMVNDGSTDRSADIADAFARRDPRFHLTHQENHGLGHARNTGARLASGDFLTFVDSDDLLPHYACRTAIRVLEETGSDFVSGNEYRFDSTGAYPAPMLEHNFGVTRLRTNVTKTPALMRDLLPHNKTYRRSFWDAAGLEFPEGILFEDGPVSVRAHALAKSVDLIATPIYYWRLREDTERSLSQLADDDRFFVDRIYASTLSADFLEAHRSDLLDAFYSWDLQHKFPVMFKALPQAPRTVQERFLEAARPYLRRIPPDIVKRMHPTLRGRLRATLTGELAGVLRLLPSAGGSSAPVPDARRHLLGRVRSLAGKSRAVRAAASYIRVSPGSGTVESAVMEFGRDGAGLYVRGYGHIGGIPAEGRFTAADRVLWARHQDTRAVARWRLRSTQSPEATAATGDAYFSYRWSGFHASLPLDRLKDAEGRWHYGTWLLALGALTARGVARQGLRWGADAHRAQPVPFPLDAETRLVPTVTNGVVGFRIERSDAALEECTLDGSDLVVTGRVRGVPNGQERLVIGRVVGVPELTVPVTWLPGNEEEARFTARIAPSDVVVMVSPVAATMLAGYPDRLYVAVRPAEGDVMWHRLACDPDTAGVAITAAAHHVIAQPGPDGYLTLTVRPPGPVAESANWTSNGELMLRGQGADGLPGFQLVGRHHLRRERRILPCQVHPDGSWQAIVDPERVPMVGSSTALREGRWRLAVHVVDRANGWTESDLPCSPRIVPTTPPYRLAYADQYWLQRTPSDELALRIKSRLGEDERGTYNSVRLRKRVHNAVRRTPLRQVVLYESFYGKQYSDAPRAVHEHLLAAGAEVEHIWLTRDGQAPVPEGTRTVEADSRGYLEALATSRYVVANTHLPQWIRRRSGQVIAQTWHGIGFKKVAFDMAAVHFANKTYLDKLVREAPNWSFLVSPSSRCTEIMRRAFRYDGEILEIGSPRNDILFTGDREEITERVRSALGVPAGKKILLYAPTWRDNEFHGPGRYKFDMRLDVSRFPRALLDEYVLLVRRHPNTVDDLLGQDSEFVFDLANYPDVRDLLVAADVLITDYSTISLDFLNTGRPILYYAYDLASYRDDLRGFYFDLEREGPGPVLETSRDVVDALQDLDTVTSQFRDRYENLRRIYCHAEDGHATERLIDRLLRDRH